MNWSTLTADNVQLALSKQGLVLAADPESDPRMKPLYGAMPERYLLPDQSRLWIYAVTGMEGIERLGFGDDPNYESIRLMSDAPHIYIFQNVMLLYMHPSEANPTATGWKRRGSYREQIAAAIDPLYGDLVIIGLDGAVTNRDRFLAFAAHVRQQEPDYVRVLQQGGDSAISHDLSYDGKRLRYTYHDSMRGERVQSIATTVDCSGIDGHAAMNGVQYELTGCKRVLPNQPPAFRLVIPDEQNRSYLGDEP